MHDWLTEAGAKLIFALTGVDKAYRVFDAIRSEIVLALGNDAVLDRFNELVYGATDSYRADTSSFREYLFHWEAEAVKHFFPPPPARILVGGAGGGREALVLAKRGYQVTAFDPALALVEAMQARIGAGVALQAYRAGYQDMPRLYSVEMEGPITNIESLGPFDASIIGWTSISHLRTLEERVRTFKTFGEMTTGPILTSFFSPGLYAKPSAKRAVIRRLVPGRFNREPGNAFSVHIGFYHEIDLAELAFLVREAGLKIMYFDLVGTDTNWPHAVLLSCK